jgi:hypothetical protein
MIRSPTIAIAWAISGTTVTILPFLRIVSAKKRVGLQELAARSLRLRQMVAGKSDHGRGARSGEKMTARDQSVRHGGPSEGIAATPASRAATPPRRRRREGDELAPCMGSQPELTLAEWIISLAHGGLI